MPNETYLYRYGRLGTISHFATDDDKVNCTEFPDGCFLTRLPVLPVINAIYTNFPPSEYHYAILSACPHEQSMIEKHDWLDRHFPVTERHFIRWKQVNKADYIKEYAEQHNIDLADIILIDDEHKILSEVEHLGCQVLHPSRLLTLAQKPLRRVRK